ncbi:hypothetical protein D3C87_957310 [compost metagenome]
MAILFYRGSRPLERMRSAIPLIPTALITLLGEEKMTRGTERARGWMLDNLKQGLRATRKNVKPLRKAAKRELSKSEQLADIVPFFPAIPLIPVAVVAGLATFSTILAVRASRHDREIVSRLDAIEAELAAIRQQREWQAQPGTEAKPAQLPWS